MLCYLPENGCRLNLSTPRSPSYQMGRSALLLLFRSMPRQSRP